MNFFPDLTALGFSQLAFFALVAIGMTHIIVDSSIFAPVRDWIRAKMPGFVSKIIECYQCCGTWVGFFAAFWLLGCPVGEGAERHVVVHPAVVFLGGCAGSFLAYSAAVLLTYYEAQSVVSSTKDQ